MNGRLVEEDGAIPFVIVGVVALGGVLGLAWAGQEWAQLLVNEAGGELTVWVLRGAFWALDLVALQASTAPTTTDWATPVLDGPALPIWALAALVTVATLIAETVAGMATGNTPRIVQAVGRALLAGMLATLGASLLLAVGGALSGLGRIALDASGAGVDAPLVPLQEVLMDTARQRDSGAELFIAFLAGLVIVFTSLAIYFTLAMRPVLLAAIIVFLPVAHALAVWTPMRRIQARTWALALAVLLADAAILTMFAVTNTVIGQPEGVDRLIFGTFGLLLAALAPAALARIIGVPELQTAVQTMTRGSRAVAAGAGIVAAKGALLAAATARHTPAAGAGGGGGPSGGTPTGAGSGGPGPVSGATPGPAGGGTSGPGGNNHRPGGGSSTPAAASRPTAGSGANGATRGTGSGGPAGSGTPAVAPGVTANGSRATTSATPGATSGASSAGSAATVAGSGGGVVATEAGPVGGGATTGSASAATAAAGSPGGEPAGAGDGHLVGGAVAGRPGAGAPVGPTRAAASLDGGTTAVLGGETPGVSSSTVTGGTARSAGGSAVSEPAATLSTPASSSPAPTRSVGVASPTGPASAPSGAASASAVPPSGPVTSAETADAPPSSRAAPSAPASPMLAAGQRSGPVADSVGPPGAGATASARPAGLQPPTPVPSASGAPQAPDAGGVVQPVSEAVPSSPAVGGWRSALTRVPSGVADG
jgi:hypothetical protein